MLMTQGLSRRIPCLLKKIFSLGEKYGLLPYLLSMFAWHTGKTNADIAGEWVPADPSQIDFISAFIPCGRVGALSK